MKQNMKTETEILKNYPIKSSVQGWYLKLSEISVNAYEVQGSDLFGRTVSRQGDSPDELIELCEKDAKVLINKDEQINQILSILTWGIEKYVFQKTGKTSFSASDLRELYHITKQDIFNYIEEYGLPEELCKTSPSQKDGMYFFEHPNEFEVFYQEKACKFDVKRFDNQKDAIRYLVDEKIYHSGIQLKDT